MISISFVQYHRIHSQKLCTNYLYICKIVPIRDPQLFVKIVYLIDILFITHQNILIDA
jgi:hypothetical protein